MRIPAIIRSATAVALSLVLVSATALPLVPCADPSERSGCPMGAAQENEHAKCHETRVPSTKMSCGCESDKSPVQPTPNATRTVEAPPVTLSAQADPLPADPAHHVSAVTAGRARTRPLFSLFSAFLI